MTESLEVVVARIDENVKSIKIKIGDMKDVQKDHEDRIRDNEKFKQRGYGALGIISFVVSVILIILGWIVMGLG